MIKTQLRLPLTGFFFGLVLLGFAWWLVHRPPLTFASLPAATPTVTRPTKAQVDYFYSAHVSPLFAIANQQDSESVDHAIAQIHAAFGQFHASLPGFADDLTSLSTRGGVIKRMTADQWTKLWGNPGEAHRVTDYVGTKFEDQVVSEQKLRDVLRSALDRLQNDLQANHNRLVAGVKAAVSLPDCPLPPMAHGWDQTFKAAEERAVQLAVFEGRDSVTTGIASFVGGSILAMAAEKVLAPVVIEAVMTVVGTELAASTAVATASAGGTTAALGTGGGAVGTTVGPVGTVIGVGIGFAVGAVVDFFMTKYFKTKLLNSCNAYLDNVEGQIIKGQANHPGLDHLLHTAVDAQDTALHTALLKQLEALAQ